MVVSPAIAQAVSSDWPQFRESQVHQAHNTTEALISDTNVHALGVAWTGATGAAISSSPSVSNGVVYIGSDDGKLYAFAVGCATGGGTCTPIWTGATGGAITSSPSVSGTHVYVGSSDGKLYAFTVGCGTAGAACSPVWTGATGGSIDSSPMIDLGVVYVGSTDGKLYAFDASGVTGCAGAPKTCTPIWTGTTGGAVESSPGVGGTTVFVGSDDGKLYAFGEGCGSAGASCNPLFTATTGAAIHSSPATLSGVVYVGSLDGKLYAFDATGVTGCSGTPLSCTPIWTGNTGSPIYSSPSLGDGRVWIGSDSGSVYSFHVGCNAGGGTCTPQWTSATGGAVRSSPSSAHDVLFAGANDGKLYAFDADCPTPTCTPAWSMAIGTTIQSSPAISNGVVYVGSSDGKLYAFHLLIDHLMLNPANGSIAAGAVQAFTAHAFDASNTDLGDVTALTTFTSSAPGTCTLNSCGASFGTTLTITGALDGVTATATLTVLNSGSTYVAVTPTRLLDTRNGTGLVGPFSSHVARTFQVTGGAVPATATAVTGNLTVTQQTSLGFLFIGPAPVNNPTSSTLNFPMNDDRANGVTVALSTTGTLSVTYAAPTLGPTAHVIFDLTGYFLPDPSGSSYVPLTPTRLLDSRNGTGLSGAFSSHVARTFQVTGGVVPTGATAVTGNLTVTQQTNLGFLFIGPVPTNDPTSSTLNFPKGDDRANGVTVDLSSTGTLSVTYAAPVLGPTAHVLFDVTGYFVHGPGATFVPVTPTRLLDSRNGTGLSGAFSSHVARQFQVTGGGVVPATATAVTGNLTVTQQTNIGFLYVGPAAQPNPTSSTLNFPMGDDRANNVDVALSPTGSLSVTYAGPVLGPTAQAIFDVTGYFVP
jgi:outer membrane protein assembly factor BamB